MDATAAEIDWRATSQGLALLSFVLYSFSVTAGIMLTSRAWAAPTRPYLHLHRYLAIGALVSLVGHVTIVIATGINGAEIERLAFVNATPPQVLGVTSFYLAILVTASFSLKGRKRMTPEFWRGLHFFGYAVWMLALGHALLVGDLGDGYLWLYGICIITVSYAAWWRVSKGRGTKKAEPHHHRVVIEVTPEHCVVRLEDEQHETVHEQTTRTLRGAKRLGKRWLRDLPIDDDPESPTPIILTERDLKR